MKDVNKVILVGRLGKDPIQRETKTGTPVVHFTMATSRRTSPDPEGSGEAGEATQWHHVVAWGKLGEACAQYLKKGNSVYVEGSYRSHKFEGREGRPVTSFEVYAEDVSFLGGRRSSTAEASAQASADASIGE